MIAVIRAGLLTTVQDLGRRGYRQLGVGQGGALDPLALTVGNRLVGNEANTAALEITVGSVVRLSFYRSASIALTGADVSADLDGERVWHGWRTPAREGQILTLAAPRSGMRAYLAIAGGIDVPPVLGSRSTDLNAGFGGLAGRALQDGDSLPLGSATPPTGRQGLKLPEWDPFVRAMPGPEYDGFKREAQQALWQTEWKVSAQSNRMGYRLLGPALTYANPGELLSHAVLPGTVQVPPNGQPIVLLADAQTTGGYPRIATVIEADLWKLAQVRLGATFRLVACTLATARAARQALQYYLNRIEGSLYGH
ncbi:MAG: biotin-dependent carboxyltransferase family protein [Gammaproteobacteria bacterium]